MTEPQYRNALTAARDELERLLEQHDLLEIRIARVRQSIAALSALCDEPAETDLGLTDAVRTVLRGSVEALAAPDVKERLDALGVDTASHVNPLASIHTVLKRLVRSGEAGATEGYGGKIVYWHQRPMPTMVVSALPVAGGPKLRRRKR